MLSVTLLSSKVTMVSNLPPPDDNPSITYINHGLTSFSVDNMFDVRDDPSKMMAAMLKGIPEMTHEFYDVPVIKDLYAKRHEFDLVVFDIIYKEVCVFKRIMQITEHCSF